MYTIERRSKERLMADLLEQKKGKIATLEQLKSEFDLLHSLVIDGSPGLTEENTRREGELYSRIELLQQEINQIDEDITRVEAREA